MKYYPNVATNPLEKGLTKLLDLIRKEKNFSPSQYVLAKTTLINQYFLENKLDTAIIALSGGIDSAVAYQLLKKAKESKNSPIKNVIGLTLPALNCIGVTNQAESKDSANLLECETINIEPLTHVLEEIINKFTMDKMSPWAQGQAIPYLRTSLLYSLTAALSDSGKKSILIGTTNRDEGSYLGYIGKASDGLTDLQVISDLHKSEVYSVAKTLNVPEKIIQKTPTGDMYDNRTDEEVFGAPYDFVELYTNLLYKYQSEYLESTSTQEYFTLNEIEKEQFNTLANNIVDLHNFNRHKYISCSSAIHLDLTPFNFPGGWRNNTTWDKEIFTKIDETKYVNPVKIIPRFYPQEEKKIEVLSNNIFKIENLLDKAESSLILEQIENTNENWLRANTYGKPDKDSSCGSYRKSWYSKEFSKVITDRISNLLFKTYVPNNEIKDDEKESLVWTFKEVGSLFRFIKYQKGDALVPHYDESFKVGSHSKTLFSIVIYLTEGSTQFFEETRENHSYEDFEDLSSELNMTPYLKAYCKPGDALIFQHRLLHDCPIVDKDKVIIRSDLVFEKPNLGGALKGY